MLEVYTESSQANFILVEADHSRPSSAKVKECMELYSTPPICLHGGMLS